MNEIKITEKDLIGDIAGFPIEVVKKMVEEQVRQGNKADVSIFQECANWDKKHGGFEWEETEDGFEFWDMVVLYKEFDEFFEKYPKQETSEMQDAENTATQAHKEIDWEQRRYEIAKSAVQGFCSNGNRAALKNIEEFPMYGIALADALIAELKKGGAE